MDEYSRGIADACRIILERGQRIRGAIQPELTVREIVERLDLKNFQDFK